MRSAAAVLPLWADAPGSRRNAPMPPAAATYGLAATNLRNSRRAKSEGRSFMTRHFTPLGGHQCNFVDSTPFRFRWRHCSSAAPVHHEDTKDAKIFLYRIIFVS